MNKTKFKINTAKLIIKDLNFEDVDIKKSMDASDAAAVDEKGRFLIFRNVRGNVVPMHVSATDYAEHLAKNGINIDPADQNMLSDLEDQVSSLAEIGSQDPRYAAKLEQLLVKKIAMATGYQNQYQQQVNQTPEQNRQLRESAKQHEAAGTMQSRVDPTSDKGWGDYLDKYIADFGNKHLSKDSDSYKALLAYGAVLKEGLHLARAGKSGNSVSIPDIIKKLRADYTNTDFVKHMAELTGEDEIDTRLRLARGLRVLDSIIDDDNNEWGVTFNKNFNNVYNKMYSDFTDEKLSIGEFDKPDLGNLGNESSDIPDELPSKVTGKELHRVQKEFNNVVDKGGNVHQVANQVFDHLLKRLVDTFPSGTERYTQLALNGNLIESARMAHKRGYQFAESAKDFQLHKDPSALVNSMLNEVDLAIKSGSDGAYVAAIKKLSTLLGELDGYKMHADNPRATPRNFNDRWGDIMMGARRKNTGHASIESLLSSPEARSHAGIDNSILRLPAPQDPVNAVIKPKTPPPAKFDIEMPDEEEATTSTPRIEAPKLEVNQFDKKIQTADGKYQIRGNPETNTIDLLHEGEIVASHQRGNFPKVTDIFNKFNAEIENHVNSPKKTPQDMGETTVEPRNNFHEDYSSDEKGIISSPDGYTATKVTDEDGSEYLKLSNPTGNEITSVPFDGSSESEKVALSKLSDIRSQNNYPIKQSRISTSEEAMSRYGFSKLQKVQHALEQAGGVIKSAAGTAGFGANISLPNGEVVRIASQKGSSDIFVKVGKSPAKELSSSGLEEYLKTVKPKEIETKEPEKPLVSPEEKPSVAKTKTPVVKPPAKINGRIIKPDEAPDPVEIARITGAPQQQPEIDVPEPKNTQVDAVTPQPTAKQNTTTAKVAKRVDMVQKRPANYVEAGSTSDLPGAVKGAMVLGTKLSLSNDQEFDFGNESLAKQVKDNPELTDGFSKITSFVPSSNGIDIDLKGGKQLYISAAEFKRAKSKGEKDRLFKDMMASAGVNDNNVFNAIRMYTDLHTDYADVNGRFLSKVKTTNNPND